MHAVRYKMGQEAVDFLGDRKLRQVAKVRVALARRNTSSIEQVVRVLKYSHECLEEYGLQFLRVKAKTADIVQ